jgi:hypothetical protein
MVIQWFNALGKDLGTILMLVNFIGYDSYTGTFMVHEVLVQ